MPRLFRLHHVAAGALTVLTACTPLVEMPAASADGPRISHLEFEPPESAVGCTVMLRFQFETKSADITGGRVRWSVAMGRRPTADSLTLDPELFQGQTSGQVILALRLKKVGHYHYLVQVEDSAGRRSNVLEQDLTAEVSWAPGVIPCSQ